MNCKYCEYKWEPRVTQPKACPRCKRRFDYPREYPKKEVGTEQVL